MQDDRSKQRKANRLRTAYEQLEWRIDEGPLGQDRAREALLAWWAEQA